MYAAMPDRTAGERTIQNLPQTQPLRQGWTMGQPADSRTAAVREDYLPDLTRPYHNLLSVTRNDGSPAQTFYWDSNAAAMEENGTLHYYLQDEMGSPLRVSGYDSTDSMADGNHDTAAAYLTYGYDEFGNDLARTTGKELEEAGIPSPYTMQGEGQPFGYTGYRYDTLGATYFAQAREYDPQTGRFHAQDVIAGNGAVPVTLNRYGYCWGNPMGMVDLDGLTPEEKEYAVYYLNNIDGAKVFGHNALMLVDNEGNGKVYSYMGVIDSDKLTDFFALTLDSAMGYAELNPEQVAKFLADGEIDLTKRKIESGEMMIDTHDNYDRALTKRITEEEYWILYNEIERVKREDATYSIYVYNCDTVVVHTISMIDPQFNGYATGNMKVDLWNSIRGPKDWMMRNFTPDASFNSIKKQACGWEMVFLGDTEAKEIVLKDIYSFPANMYEMYFNILEDISTCIE